MPRFDAKPPSCDGCGACCEFQCYPPLTRDELEALPEPLQTETRRDMKHDRDAEPNRPCTWWDVQTQRCRHHDTHLPAVCSGFEVGADLCLAYIRENPVYVEEVGRVVRGDATP